MSQKSLQQTQQTESEWLSITEAAALVPYHPDKSTVARWALRGVRGRKLPSSVVGGRRLIKRSDLLAFLAENAEPSMTADEQNKAIAAAQVVDTLLK